MPNQYHPIRIWRVRTAQKTTERKNTLIKAKITTITNTVKTDKLVIIEEVIENVTIATIKQPPHVLNDDKGALLLYLITMRINA